jgi:hypothetical protein
MAGGGDRTGFGIAIFGLLGGLTTILLFGTFCIPVFGKFGVAVFTNISPVKIVADNRRINKIVIE